MKTFHVLSALLTYPSLALQQALPEVPTLLEKGVLNSSQIESLKPLLVSLQHDDLYDLQEQYVLLFDRSRSLSLNLFEHIHGESRDRGGAMVDLLETYRAGGLDLTATELPDYLPVLLEFLSTQKLELAQEILNDAGHILIALAERLERRKTPYAAVLQLLVEISKADFTTPEAQELLAQQDDNPEDLEALDAVWEEAQVTFGPDSDQGCQVNVPHEAPIRLHRQTRSASSYTGG